MMCAYLLLPLLRFREPPARSSSEAAQIISLNKHAARRRIQLNRREARGARPELDLDLIAPRAAFACARLTISRRAGERLSQQITTSSQFSSVRFGSVWFSLRPVSQMEQMSRALPAGGSLAGKYAMRALGNNNHNGRQFRSEGVLLLLGLLFPDGR